MEVETDFDRRLDDIDVESILARVEQRPLIFARKRCLYQGKICYVKMTPTYTLITKLITDGVDVVRILACVEQRISIPQKTL